MNLGDKKPLVVALCIGAIVISILSLFITQCERTPRIDVARYAAAAEGLAKHMGEDLPEGTKIVLVVMDPDIKSQVFSAQTKGFETGFAAHGSKLKIIETYPIKLEDMSRGTGSGMPTKVYFDVLQKHPDVDVIASLVGIPLLSDAEIDQLPANIPKLYALILYGIGVKRAFDEGILSGSVIPKYEKIEEGKDPQESEALFNKYYRFVNEKDYESLTF